jgi:hypothetical protein
MMARGALSGLLVLLACVVAVAVVPVRWLDAQLHTDAYAETVRPLPRDPQMQRAISDRLAEAIASSGQEVPPVVARTIQSKVPVMLNTPEAGEIWVTANMTARDALLDGSGATVTVDIDELIAILSDRLRAEGVDVPAELPAHSSRVVLVDSPAVARAREAAELTATLAQALPLVAGGLLLLALLISGRRLRTLAFAGIGVAVVALAEIFALNLGRDRYLATVKNDTSRALLDAVAQAFARSLRADLLVMLLVALGAAAGGILLRLLLTRRRVRDDLELGPEQDAPAPVGTPGGAWPADAPEPPAAAGAFPRSTKGPPPYTGHPPRYADQQPQDADQQPQYADQQLRRPGLPPGDAPLPQWHRPGRPQAEGPPRRTPRWDGP